MNPTESRVHEIDKRVSNLAARMEERWDAHDKRSEDIWRYVREQLNKIENNTRQVVDHAKKYTNTIVRWAIGIPVAVFGLIKLVEIVNK